MKVLKDGCGWLREKFWPSRIDVKILLPVKMLSQKQHLGKAIGAFYGVEGERGIGEGQRDRLRLGLEVVLTATKFKLTSANRFVARSTSLWYCMLVSFLSRKRMMCGSPLSIKCPTIVDELDIESSSA